MSVFVCVRVRACVLTKPPPSFVSQIALDPPAAASEQLVGRCAQAYHLPGMGAWCPPQLLDVSQLTGYYKQQTLEVHDVGIYTRTQEQLDLAFFFV